jgi:uncharacterized protein YheU (UPF0270 family)
VVRLPFPEWPDTPCGARYPTVAMDYSRRWPEPGVIPYQELAPTALRGLIEYFGLREGTEHGSTEVPLEVKHAQVMRLLEKGTAPSCSIRLWTAQILKSFK